MLLGARVNDWWAASLVRSLAANTNRPPQERRRAQPQQHSERHSQAAAGERAGRQGVTGKVTVVTFVVVFIPNTIVVYIHIYIYVYIYIYTFINLGVGGPSKAAIVVRVNAVSPSKALVL